MRLSFERLKSDPRARWKVVLAVLAIANLAVLFLLVKPFGGSASDLEQQLGNMRTQYGRDTQQLHRVKALMSKIGKAYQEQDKFISAYFMERRTASSTILTEIGDNANKSGLKARDHSFVIEPVEGADNLSMMTINANYEGSYSDLVQFVNLIDRSQRFLIIDYIQASPQQNGLLAVRFKLNTFVREKAQAPAGSIGAAQP